MGLGWGGVLVWWWLCIYTNLEDDEVFSCFEEPCVMGCGADALLIGSLFESRYGGGPKPVEAEGLGDEM